LQLVVADDFLQRQRRLSDPKYFLLQQNKARDKQREMAEAKEAKELTRADRLHKNE
jgi:hypothetical protein